jgi:hypothetical protein
MGNQLLVTHRRAAIGFGGQEKSGLTAIGKSGCQFHSLLVPAFNVLSVGVLIAFDPIN